MTEEQQSQIFQEWLNEHKGILFKVIRSFAQSAEDQEDLFQEISVQLWRSVPKFKTESKVSTWIYRLALNQAIKWSTKEQRRPAEEHKEEFSRLLYQQAPADNSRLNWLYEQIHELEQTDRSICLMMFDGFSYKEIGEVVGISENYVGVKVNRIKEKLTAMSKKLN
ncbi:RNA polymerase sigma factor [Roseivirga pacifica]|uniref:RNA polymerase sigma factor n=1 Tax=Roseivirga pacifica TaxID=1267423 RepID=UPI0020944859|nr:sigma-70 family RNA polymerase sigma factor [Roseivirga pacifica]MCO6357780.1 sigma-70 family RNA polymerase sigma factor [Roseivirga pacifica]MCO6366033.1 sigma-70 family RNA polymerase sigma factor [Roseivirga pacifica]MCO6371361.1 sigma-70 family RNA polymerase sigma factor [Roseivirga pacifica]MCO6375467.1 sigma-70 family RNA polymerase sigma factor [Roseivirga pacifica]MCO6378739.1 sigma-70 family RNA polymerase sigma factor [Roseivirga pacifica]